VQEAVAPLPVVTHAWVAAVGAEVLTVTLPVELASWVTGGIQPESSCPEAPAAGSMNAVGVKVMFPALMAPGKVKSPFLEIVKSV
jgi:hypothetical protein